MPLPDFMAGFVALTVFVIIVLITAFLVLWLSVGVLYTLDTNRSINDWRRSWLQSLIAASVIVGGLTLSVFLVSGNAALFSFSAGALALLLGYGITLYKQLDNTSNPNFNEDFPTFGVLTILSSVPILFSTLPLLLAVRSGDRDSVF